MFTTVGRFFFNASPEAHLPILPTLSAVWVDFNLTEFSSTYITPAPTYNFDELNDYCVNLLYIMVMDPTFVQLSPTE